MGLAFLFRKRRFCPSTLSRRVRYVHYRSSFSPDLCSRRCSDWASAPFARRLASSVCFIPLYRSAEWGQLHSVFSADPDRHDPSWALNRPARLCALPPWFCNAIRIKPAFLWFDLWGFVRIYSLSSFSSSAKEHDCIKQPCSFVFCDPPGILMSALTGSLFLFLQVFQQHLAHHRAGRFGERQPQCPAAGRLQRAGYHTGAAEGLHHQLLRDGHPQPAADE